MKFRLPVAVTGDLKHCRDSASAIWSLHQKSLDALIARARLTHAQIDAPTARVAGAVELVELAKAQKVTARPLAEQAELEVLDPSIANVSSRHIAGSLAASIDE